MKRLAALLFLLCLTASVQAANTGPVGSNGDIQYYQDNKFAPYGLGNNLAITTSGGKKFLNATTSGAGGSPAGVFPQLQYTTGAAFAALSTDTLASYAAHDTIMNGLAYDPRNYGAICPTPAQATGGYQIFVSDGHTQTYNYTIPFTGSSSTDNTNFMVFTESTSGFDTANILGTSDFSVTGVNSGSGTITLNSGVVPTTGNLIVIVHDDSAAFVAASTAAVASGGYVSVPDNCTIYGSASLGTQLAEGAQLIGQGFTPNYGFQGQGIKPVLNVISPSGFAPNFGFNVSGKNQQFFEGFEITSRVPGYNSLGFLKVPVLIGANTSVGAGGGTLPGITIQYMTVNYGNVGFGSPIGGSSGYIFATARFNNFVANTVGIYGPLSDQRIVGNDFTQNGAFGITGSAGGMVIGPQQLGAGASGAAEISGNRFEFNKEGVITQSAALIHMEDNEFDANFLCGLDLSGFYASINVTGGWFRGNGNAGGSYPGSTISGHDAHVCGNSTNSGSNGVTFSNVNFINNYGEGNTGTIGTTCPAYGQGCATTPLYILDVSTTGSWNSNISFDGGSAPFGIAPANNASVTDSFIFRNGQPPGFKVQNVIGQANQGVVANGSIPSQALGLPDNSSTGLYAIGNVSMYSYDYANGTGWPDLIARKMGGTSPTLLGLGSNNFNVYDCNLVDSEIWPNFTNLQTIGNPIVAWLPADYDPGYGNGFYQAHEADTNTCRLGGLTWITVPNRNRTYAQQGTPTGSWINSTTTYAVNTGLQDYTNGDTLSMTMTTNGGPLYLWYGLTQNNGGTFQWTLDSTTTGSVAVQGQNAFTFPASNSNITLGATRIPVTTPGSHTLNLAITSTTTTGNNINIIGMGTPPDLSYHGSTPRVVLGGQVLPSTNGPQPAAVIAFNNDQMIQANQLFTDGLSVNFAPVQKYLTGSNDYDYLIELTQSGAAHVAEAFDAAMQFRTENSQAINPKDYGAACNTQFFVGSNYYGFGGHAVNTTQGSPVISVTGYKFNPGAATQYGGGDVGKVAILGRLTDQGPTTYILSVSTTSGGSSATLGENMAVTSSGEQMLMGGYPSNPQNPATAQDDTTAIQAAATAAVRTNQVLSGVAVGPASGGGYVDLPPNCMIHNLQLPNHVLMKGNKGGNQYGADIAPNMITPLWVASTSYADDYDAVTGLARNVGINLRNSEGIELKDFTLLCPAYPFINGHPGMGATVGAGIVSNAQNDDFNAEKTLIDNVTFTLCPVALETPLLLNRSVGFTANITPGPGSYGTMNVLSITTTNMLQYHSGLPITSTAGVYKDYLAIGDTITGTGLAGTTTIVQGALGGQPGSYLVSLSQTVTTEAMVTVPPGNLSNSLYVENSEFTNMHTGVNGTMSDYTFINNVFTGTFLETAFFLGPDLGDGGAGRILGGRCEEANNCFIFDGGGAVNVNNMQFQSEAGWPVVIMAGGEVQLNNNWFDQYYGPGQPQVVLDGTGAKLLMEGNDFNLTNGGGSVPYALLGTATGNSFDYVSVLGGQYSNNGGSGNPIASAWISIGAPIPAHYIQTVPSFSTINTMNNILSVSTTGGVGIGTSTPVNGTSLDLLSETLTSNSSIGLPVHTTANQPTGVTGMFGFNSTTTSPDFFGGGAWRYLPSTTTVAPAPNYTLQSTTTNGEAAQWVAPSSTSITLSATTSNQNFFPTLSPTTTNATLSTVYSSGLSYNPSKGLLTTSTALNVTATNGVYQINGSTILSEGNIGSDTTLGIGAGNPTGATSNSFNTALGNGAGGAFSGAQNNTAVGNSALAIVVTGVKNTSVGVSSLASEHGSDNTAVGYQALQFADGATNLGLGYLAGQAVTSGGSNVIIGPLVGSTTLTTGSNNILIGTSNAVDATTSSTSNFVDIGNLYEGDTSAKHIFFSGALPAITSGSGNFGTSPSIIGNDNVGTVTIGSSPGGAGTITFANVHTAAPDYCSCNNNSSGARPCQALSQSTTSVGLAATTSPFSGADQLGYICFSHRP